MAMHMFNLPLNKGMGSPRNEVSPWIAQGDKYKELKTRSLTPWIAIASTLQGYHG